MEVYLTREEPFSQASSSFSSSADQLQPAKSSGLPLGMDRLDSFFSCFISKGSIVYSVYPEKHQAIHLQDSSKSWSKLGRLLGFHASWCLQSNLGLFLKQESRLVVTINYLAKTPSKPYLVWVPRTDIAGLRQVSGMELEVRRSSCTTGCG